jgi:diaminopimelate decarboxylase
VSIIDSQLLPRTATVNDAGVLSIGGVAVAAMAEQFGTPLYVYDEEHLRNQCREAVSAFGKDRVIYATKAFLCGAMARLAHEEGLLLDVATGGELFAALHAGVPGERCVFQGRVYARRLPERGVLGST